GDAVDYHHDAGMTVRALPQRLPGQRLETIAVVSRRIGCWLGRYHPEQFPAALELLCAMAIAEEAEVPDKLRARETGTTQLQDAVAAACLTIVSSIWPHPSTPQ